MTSQAQSNEDHGYQSNIISLLGPTSKNRTKSLTENEPEIVEMITKLLVPYLETQEIKLRSGSSQTIQKIKVKQIPKDVTIQIQNHFSRLSWICQISFKLCKETFFPLLLIYI